MKGRKDSHKQWVLTCEHSYYLTAKSNIYVSVCVLCSVRVHGIVCSWGVKLGDHNCVLLYSIYYIILAQAL